MILLDIKNLTIELKTHTGVIRAVEKVNLSIKEGEVMGLVGESGSGKSLIAKAIMGVLNERWNITADRFHWKGQDIMRLSPDKRREIICKDVAMIYQEPSRYLDPTAKVGQQLLESIPTDEIKGSWWTKQKEKKQRARALLHKVGIKNHKEIADCYPSDLTEGQCQKVMIAMAIARRPTLLIADEPTTALEMITKRQVLRVLKGLNQLKHMSILLVSHDIGTFSSWTHSLSVLYSGQLVETGNVKKVLTTPYHPYTEALLKSVPDLTQSINHKERLYSLKGSIPTLKHLPIGCRLGPRCPYARAECVKTPTTVSRHGHAFSCHFPLNQS